MTAFLAPLVYSVELQAQYLATIVPQVTFCGCQQLDISKVVFVNWACLMQVPIQVLDGPKIAMFALCAPWEDTTRARVLVL